MSDLPGDLTGDLTPESARSLEAAEHALGLADASARAASEPAFAGEAAEWERRLAPLLDEAAPREPPARVWAGIEARLAPPAPGLVARPPARVRDRRLDFWRAATAGALALAAASLVLAVLPRPAPSYPPLPAPAPVKVFVAKLARPSGPVVVVAYLEAPSGNGRGRLVLTTVAAVARPGRSAELWLIPKGGAPEPLGLLDGPTAVLPGFGALRGAAAGGGALAVSIEPRGGSPTGKPTGPVIASGGFERL